MKCPSFSGCLSHCTYQPAVKTTFQRGSTLHPKHRCGVTLKPQQAYLRSALHSDSYYFKPHLTNSSNTVLLFSVWLVDSGGNEPHSHIQLLSLCPSNEGHPFTSSGHLPNRAAWPLTCLCISSICLWGMLCKILYTSDIFSSGTTTDALEIAKQLYKYSPFHKALLHALLV